MGRIRRPISGSTAQIKFFKEKNFNFVWIEQPNCSSMGPKTHPTSCFCRDTVPCSEPKYQKKGESSQLSKQAPYTQAPRPSSPIVFS